LRYLYCAHNQLDAPALNVVFAQLSRITGNISIENNPGENTCDRSIATGKGWSFMEW
jgi:hypothetical protein